MVSPYDKKYEKPGYYWGTKPSATCFHVLNHLPPERPLRLLDIGCGEGRNAVFFARNGYEVHAFDISAEGIKKTKRLALEAGVEINAFQAALIDYRLDREYDAHSSKIIER